MDNNRLMSIYYGIISRKSTLDQALSKYKNSCTIRKDPGIMQLFEGALGSRVK